MVRIGGQVRTSVGISDYNWPMCFAAEDVRRGQLPSPICLNDCCLWVEPCVRVEWHVGDADEKGGGDVRHCIGAVEPKGGVAGICEGTRPLN